MVRKGISGGDEAKEAGEVLQGVVEQGKKARLYPKSKGSDVVCTL